MFPYRKPTASLHTAAADRNRLKNRTYQGDPFDAFLPSPCPSPFPPPMPSPCLDAYGVIAPAHTGCHNYCHSLHHNCCHTWNYPLACHTWNCRHTYCCCHMGLTYTCCCYHNQCCHTHHSHSSTAISTAISTAVPTTAIRATISRCPCRKPFIALHYTQTASGQVTDILLEDVLRYCFASGHQQKKLLRFCRSCTGHCPIGRTAGLCAETVIGHKPCKAYPWWRLSYFTCCQCAPTTCLQQSCLLLLKLLQRLDLNSMTESLFRSRSGLSVPPTSAAHWHRCTAACPELRI